MAAIVSDTTQTLADGSTVQTITYADGARSEQYTPGPGTPAANQQALQVKAVNALAQNVTFLARTSPTSAQVTAQVQLLTRETSALIRLLLNQLADTAGT
jgi:hypothetical protein